MFQGIGERAGLLSQCEAITWSAAKIMTIFTATPPPSLIRFEQND